jgi:hypothetical protein
MKSRLLSLAVLASLLFLANCTYNDLWSGERIPNPSVDYMMFGHMSGFCMNCDEVYKIVDGKLFGASHQMISDPDAVALTQLPTSSYAIVSSLTTQIPNRLVTGSTTSINKIGTYFPDAGHTYIEVSQNKKVYRWYIEPGNLPSDLQVFIDAVQDALNKLN